MSCFFLTKASKETKTNTLRLGIFVFTYYALGYRIGDKSYFHFLNPEISPGA